MNLPNDRIERITRAIEQALSPTHVEVIDESHQHVGHAGARSGLGHFRIVVVAAAFAGMPLVRRHRMVYDAVGEMMTTDIHALSIDASCPEDHQA